MFTKAETRCMLTKQKLSLKICKIYFNGDNSCTNLARFYKIASRGLLGLKSELCSLRFFYFLFPFKLVNRACKIFK